MPYAHQFVGAEQIEAEVDRLLSAPPRALIVWLTSQGLELVDAKPQRPHVENCRGSWGKQGLADAAKLWLAAQEAALQRRFRLSGHRKICRFVAWRFVEAKMTGIDPVTVLADIPTDSPELDVLPADLRWVYLHPGLFPDELDHPEVQAAVQIYEQQQPPPSQGAVNWVKHCRQEKGARQKMLDEVKSYLLENRKKKKEAPNAADDEELARVLDMKAELQKLKGE